MRERELWWASRPPPMELWWLMLRDEWHGVLALVVAAVAFCAFARVLWPRLRPPPPLRPRGAASRQAAPSTRNARTAPAGASSTQPRSRPQRQAVRDDAATAQIDWSREPAAVSAHNRQAPVAEADELKRGVRGKAERARRRRDPAVGAHNRQADELQRQDIATVQSAISRASSKDTVIAGPTQRASTGLEPAARDRSGTPPATPSGPGSGHRWICSVSDGQNCTDITSSRPNEDTDCRSVGRAAGSSVCARPLARPVDAGEVLANRYKAVWGISKKVSTPSLEQAERLPTVESCLW